MADNSIILFEEKPIQLGLCDECLIFVDERELVTRLKITKNDSGLSWTTTVALCSECRKSKSIFGYDLGSNEYNFFVSVDNGEPSCSYSTTYSNNPPIDGAKSFEDLVAFMQKAMKGKYKHDQ